MSVTNRQNRLLLAEDWKRIYQTFRNADFRSYDFDGLRRTMISYIRENYPEDFNDYIDSSEYLALIDLIAFLGQNISYRIDLNSREMLIKNNKLKLTEKEIYTITYLSKLDRPVSIDELQEKVWSYQTNIETHTVETHIYRLRKKIFNTFNDDKFIISEKDGYQIK